MGATEGLGEGSSASSALPPPPALQRLRGPADLAEELAELERERAACQGRRARRPWELFRDRALRRQVASLVVLGGAVELCGNDAVSSLGQAGVGGERGGGRAGGEGRCASASRPSPPPPRQVYAYASAVFSQARIPPEKVQYAAIGTGCCELLAALLSVSLPPG